MPLYGIKKYNSVAQLRAILNGTPVEGASGTLGTNGAGSPNLGVPAATGDQGDFTNASVGDRVIIFGESTTTVFLIGTKTDNQNVILDNNIVAAHIGDAVWRVVKVDAIAVSDIQFGGPMHGPNDAQGMVIYVLP